MVDWLTNMGRALHSGSPFVPTNSAVSNEKLCDESPIESHFRVTDSYTCGLMFAKLIELKGRITPHFHFMT